jgi:hypothetical protein
VAEQTATVGDAAMRDSLETPQHFWLAGPQTHRRRSGGVVHSGCALRLSLRSAFADGVVYLRDVCLTLAAFVAAAPAAAHALVAGGAVSSAVSSGVSSPGDGGGGGLLAALQGVHDELAPALAAAVRRPKAPAQPATQVLHASQVAGCSSPGAAAAALCTCCAPSCRPGLLPSQQA